MMSQIQDKNLLPSSKSARLTARSRVHKKAHRVFASEEQNYFLAARRGTDRDGCTSKRASRVYAAGKVKRRVIAALIIFRLCGAENFLLGSICLASAARASSSTHSRNHIDSYARLRLFLHRRCRRRCVKAPSFSNAAAKPLALLWSAGKIITV